MPTTAPVEDFEEVSTITDKGQTTVPRAVRKALGLGAGDKIAFRVGRTGVSVRRAEPEEGDPAIGAFLTFLANDIARNPGNLESLTPALADRVKALVGDMDVDSNAEIDGDVAL